MANRFPKSQVFYSDISDLAGASAVTKPAGKLLHHETFDGGTLDNWVVELQQPKESTVSIAGDKLDIDANGGATIWFKPELRGDLVIEFDATRVKAGGPNDRVSDLNCFWMATDPAGAEGIFSRGGRFGEYDNLRLYYASVGGNGNRTTRFRKYHGDGAKPLLFEHSDAAHLLVPNRRYHIVIEVVGKVTRFSVDGEIYFEFEDPEPLREGRFGFHTVNSHLWIHNFRVSDPAP